MTRSEALIAALDWDGSQVDRSLRLIREFPEFFGSLTLATVRRYLCDAVAERRARPPVAAKTELVPEVLDDGALRVVYASDLHIPYHDPRAVAALKAECNVRPPDVLILGGDIIDCYHLSRFRKDPSRASHLQDEVDEAIEVLRPLVALAKRVVYLIGNHETRLEKTLWDIPALASCRGLIWPELFRPLGEVEFMDHVEIGPVLFLHGFRASLHTAWAMVLREFPGRIVVQGHTHRPELKTWGGTSECWVSGHLCDAARAGAYAANAVNHWRQGFVTGAVSRTHARLELVLL